MASMKVYTFEPYTTTKNSKQSTGRRSCSPGCCIGCSVPSPIGIETPKTKMPYLVLAPDEFVVGTEAEENVLGAQLAALYSLKNTPSLHLIQFGG